MDLSRGLQSRVSLSLSRAHTFLSLLLSLFLSLSFSLWRYLLADDRGRGLLASPTQAESQNSRNRPDDDHDNGTSQS